MVDRPTLSQVQIIQSLTEALSWFEKEMSWGVSSGELNHLTGRWQMALDTNQRVYDVVSASNERISVKTITTSTHVGFNQNTFHHVDRVMILRINIDDEKGVSVEELLDASAEELRQLMREQAGNLVYPITRGTCEERPAEYLEITARASYSDLEIVKYESGAIRVLRGGAAQEGIVKETLRSIATEVGADLFNSKGRISFVL